MWVLAILIFPFAVIWVYRFRGLWRRFRGLWVYPGGGLTRGETGQGSTLNILKKEKDPIKDNFLSYQC